MDCNIKEFLIDAESDGEFEDTSEADNLYYLVNKKRDLVSDFCTRSSSSEEDDEGKGVHVERGRGHWLGNKPYKPKL